MVPRADEDILSPGSRKPTLLELWVRGWVAVVAMNFLVFDSEHLQTETAKPSHP